MQEKKYVVGLDFGTLSCRCMVVDAADGREVAEEVCAYPHGIMEQLPTGEPVPPSYALQHPGDYLETLEQSVRGALEKAGILPGQVAGIGLDFTSCTILPVSRHRTPLCFEPEHEHDPHAWVKLWKHHGATAEADEITELAKKRKENWLKLSGGRMSAEYGLPKILETLRRSPEVYRDTDRFMEAGDWLVSMLTGREVHSLTFAGYKLQWSEESGYFSPDFLQELDPALAEGAGGRLSGQILPLNARCLHLNETGAVLTGLSEGTPVAVPVIDAHAGMPGCGAVKEGDLMMVLGTSACHLVHYNEKKAVPGIFGCVRDGVIPGLVTYEAGQSAVGDLLDWFVQTGFPESLQKEAKEKGKNIHELLSSQAAELAPGESGLVALDWLGGNRTPLNDASLTGVMTGLTLSTTPAAQYRAWTEALAFGTRMIFENYEKSGVPVNRILVSGGIAGKNPFLMQTFADVTGKRLEAVRTAQAAALGSAVYAAAAAGLYATVEEAAKKMHSPVAEVYEPDPAVKPAYDRLYGKYCRLFELFGSGF